MSDSENGTVMSLMDQPQVQRSKDSQETAPAPARRNKRMTLPKRSECLSLLQDPSAATEEKYSWNLLQDLFQLQLWAS